MIHILTVKKTCEAILKDIKDYDDLVSPRFPECEYCISKINEIIKRGLK